MMLNAVGYVTGVNLSINVQDQIRRKYNELVEAHAQKSQQQVLDEDVSGDEILEAMADLIEDDEDDGDDNDMTTQITLVPKG